MWLILSTTFSVYVIVKNNCIVSSDKNPQRQKIVILLIYVTSENLTLNFVFLTFLIVELSVNLHSLTIKQCTRMLIKLLNIV